MAGTRVEKRPENNNDENFTGHSTSAKGEVGEGSPNAPKLLSGKNNTHAKEPPGHSTSSSIDAPMNSSVSAAPKGSDESGGDWYIDRRPHFPRDTRTNHRSRSRTSSPSPRHLQGLSRGDRSPYEGEERTYRGSDRSPAGYRGRDEFTSRGREPSRDYYYRGRSPDRYGRRENYIRRKRSRSRSLERYGYGNRSPSPKRWRRSYDDRPEFGHDRNRRYESPPQRYQSRTRTLSREPPLSPLPRRGRIRSPTYESPSRAAQDPRDNSGLVRATPSNHAAAQDVPTPPPRHEGRLEPSRSVHSGASVGAQSPTRANVGQPSRSSAARATQHMVTKSRRLYVGNLPYQAGLTDVALTHFFNALHMAAYGPSEGATVPPVTSVWLHQDGKFGFMETRSDQDAMDVMQFSGVSLHGRPLRVNRPSDYNPAVHNPSSVERTPSKMNYSAVVELCSKLGPVVGAPPAPASYLESQIAEASAPNHEVAPCSKGDVHSKEHGRKDDTLYSNKEDPPLVDKSHVKPVLEPGPPALRSAPAPEPRPAASDTVVSLKNIVTDGDLDCSDEDYEGLKEEISEECVQYGSVTSLEIPRSGNGRGMVFVGFSKNAEARVAVEKLSDRAFDGRIVEASIVSGVSNAKEAVKKVDK